MLARIIPNLRTEGIEVKDMGAHQTLRTTVLEITRTYSESELKARAIAAEEKAEAEKAQQAKDLKDFEENRARVAKGI